MNKPGFSLAILLVFMALTSTIIAAAVATTIVNSEAASKFDLGIESFAVAEAGLENGILRLLRDPSYSGETISIGGGTAVIAVSGSSPYVITSTGRIYDFSHTLSATAAYVNGILTISTWKEIYP